MTGALPLLCRRCRCARAWRRGGVRWPFQGGEGGAVACPPRRRPPLCTNPARCRGYRAVPGVAQGGRAAAAARPPTTAAARRAASPPAATPSAVQPLAAVRLVHSPAASHRRHACRVRRCGRVPRPHRPAARPAAASLPRWERLGGGGGGGAVLKAAGRTPEPPQPHQRRRQRRPPPAAWEPTPTAGGAAGGCRLARPAAGAGVGPAGRADAAAAAAATAAAAAARVSREGRHGAGTPAQWTGVDVGAGGAAGASAATGTPLSLCSSRRLRQRGTGVRGGWPPRWRWLCKSRHDGGTPQLTERAGNRYTLCTRPVRHTRQTTKTRDHPTRRKRNNLPARPLHAAPHRTRLRSHTACRRPGQNNPPARAAPTHPPPLAPPPPPCSRAAPLTTPPPAGTRRPRPTSAAAWRAR